MQLARGYKKGDLTYLPVMMEIYPDRVVEVLDSLIGLVDEYSNMMPTDLQDGLPPKRSVEHHIELVLGQRHQLRHRIECCLRISHNLKFSWGSC